MAQENVLHRCERRNEIELLINDRYAGRAGFLRGLKSLLLTFDSQGARIGGVSPSDDLHQGALARAVFTEHSQDLSGMESQVYATQGPHTGKGLHDPGQ